MRRQAKRKDSKCTHGDEHLVKRSSKKDRCGYTIVCKLCQRDYSREYRKKRPEKVRVVRRKTDAKRRRKQQILVEKALGPPICACCGETKKITMDHIKPKRRKTTRGRYEETQREIIAANGVGFQWLCDPCNRWKSVGPCCPCKLLWDEKFPGWRDTPS